MKRAAGSLLPLVLLLCAALPLAAQARSGSGNLRAITTADFLFLGLQDPALYPETSLEGNPANLLRLTQTLLTSQIVVDVLRSSVTNTRADSTIGALGGSLVSKETTFSPAEKVALYVPLGTDRRSPRLGIRVAGDLQLHDRLDTYQDYRSFSEDLTVEERDRPFGGTVDVALGLPTTGPGLGFALGYGFGYLPAVFPVEVDRTLSPVLTSYGAAVRDSDVFTHLARAAAGTNLSLSRAAEVSLTISYTGTFQDAARSWVAVDTDADGRADVLMPYAEWVVNTDGPSAGGPATPAISYSQMDLTVGTRLGLSPMLRLYVSDTAELFLAGTYYPLYMSSRLQYQRPRYATDLEDNLSELRQVLNGNLRCVDATLGVALATSRDARLKIGATYTRRDTVLRQDGLRGNGDLLYSTRNPDHYTELALGLEPANDSVVALLDQPALDVQQSVTLRMGWSYLPAAGPGVFVGGAVRGSHSVQTWRAYNLDTRSVWEETVTTQGIVWAFEPVAGLRIKVSDKITAGFSAAGTGLEGSLASNGETAPFNVQLQKTTLNGAQDLAGSVPFSLSVRLDFVAAL